MTIITPTRESVRDTVRHSIQEYMITEGAGALPEGWCILTDDIGDQLVDDNGDILIAPCT